MGLESEFIGMYERKTFHKAFAGKSIHVGKVTVTDENLQQKSPSVRKYYHTALSDQTYPASIYYRTTSQVARRTSSAESDFYHPEWNFSTMISNPPSLDVVGQCQKVDPSEIGNRSGADGGKKSFWYSEVFVCWPPNYPPTNNDPGQWKLSGTD